MKLEDFGLTKINLALAENERSVTESSTENSQPNDADVSPPSSNVDQIQREGIDQNLLCLS